MAEERGGADEEDNQWDLSPMFGAGPMFGGGAVGRTRPFPKSHQEMASFKKDEDGWWFPLPDAEGLGKALRFKLAGERDEKRKGLFQDILQSATHFEIGFMTNNASEEDAMCCVEELGQALGYHENPAPVLENLHIRLEMFAKNPVQTDRKESLAMILDAAKCGRLKNLQDFSWTGDRLFGDAQVEALGRVIEAGQFPFLTSLTLSRNSFGSEGATVLASCLHRVGGSLRHLDLQGNRVNHGHAALAHVMASGQLAALETLDLSSSGVEDDWFQLYGKAMSSGQLEALAAINFGKNRLHSQGAEALARAFKSGKVENLASLNLSGVQANDDSLTALVSSFELAKLPALKHLNFSEITNFRKAGCPKILATALQSRILRKAGWLPLSWALQSGNLNSLKVLDLRSCGLRYDDVRPFYDALSVNKFLTFDLKWEGYKTGIWSRYYDQELKRNREMEQLIIEMGGEQVPASFGKVYLCGNPEVGKTTFRKSLQRSYLASLCTWERKEHIEPRTRGIDVCKITSGYFDGENAITLMVWDMAGQNDYHLIHNAFLPKLAYGGGKATMFIVMCTSHSRKTARQELLYWFKFIASSVSGEIRNYRRNVFVVVNMWDGNSPTSRDADDWNHMLLALQKQFKERLNIMSNLFMVDVRRRKSIEGVKQAVIELGREMLGKETIPEICHFIESTDTWCETREHFPVLSWIDFVREIRKTGADWSEEELHAAIKYLDEVGVVIYIDKDFPKEWSIPKKKLVVLDPNWFSREVVGNMFLPQGMGVEAGLLFRAEVDPYTGSIPVREFMDFFQYLKGGWTSSEFHDLLTILLWVGLCYKGSQDNVFIPALIDRDLTGVHSWNDGSLNEGREGEWVMGFSVEHAQSEIALAPVALWHKFEVELAQTWRFNGKVPDNDFTAGKYFTTFKVDYMIVLIKVDVDEKRPTFDSIEILVKPLLKMRSDFLESTTRKQRQLDLAEDIVEMFLDTWNRVCPGIGHVQRVVWPWPVSSVRTMTNSKRNVEVNEVKKWVEQHGVGRQMQWLVGGDTVLEDQLLSTKDKEDVLKSIQGRREFTKATMRDAIGEVMDLGIISPDEVEEVGIQEVYS